MRKQAEAYEEKLGHKDEGKLTKHLVCISCDRIPILPHNPKLRQAIDAHEGLKAEVEHLRREMRKQAEAYEGKLKDKDEEAQGQAQQYERRLAAIKIEMLELQSRM